MRSCRLRGKIDAVRSGLLPVSQSQTPGVFSSVVLKCWMRQHTWEEIKLLDQMRSYLYPGSPGRTFWNILPRLRLLFSGFSQCRVGFPGLDLGSASVTSISGRFWAFHHSVGILIWTSPLASS